MRRLARGSVLCAALLCASTALATSSDCAGWPEWEKFRQLYLSDDGRIVESGSPARVLYSPSHQRARAFLAAVL